MNPFGLINAGDEKSNYGYWYGGQKLDGAMGQCFTPTKYAGAWIGTEESRGPWRYCGEGDLGMCAITRMATSILTVDPIFGVLAYGGSLLEEQEGKYSILVCDGVRNRFWVVGKDKRYGIELNRDHISNYVPVEVSMNFSSATFVVTNYTKDKHTTDLVVEVIDRKMPKVMLDGRLIKPKMHAQGKFEYSLNITKDEHEVVVYSY